MRLVDGVSIVIAKLLYDLLNPVEVFACGKISNDAFKTMNAVSTVCRKKVVPVVTLKLQPSAYRKACRSRHVGCSDPFRVLDSCQEHDLLTGGFLDIVSWSVVVQLMSLPNGQNQGKSRST